MCTLKVFVKPGGLRRFQVNSRAKGKSSTKFSTEIAHFSKKSNNFYVGHFFPFEVILNTLSGVSTL
jgi:hypothetical protein